MSSAPKKYKSLISAPFMKDASCSDFDILNIFRLLEKRQGIVDTSLLELSGGANVVRRNLFLRQKKTINIQKCFDGVIFPGKRCSCRNMLMVCYFQAKVAQKYFDGVIFPGKSCSCRNILMVCYIQAKVARGCRRKERRLQLNRLLCLKMCINKV